MVDDMDKKSKAILFGLCHFHSLMMERKKFGPQGFNMMYPFSLGDLRDSAVCLTNYMEDADAKIPWADLRYIFGQIMYGGHIVNDNDRLLCMTYLDFLMDDGLMEEKELYPFCQDEKPIVSFICPNPTSYDRYLAHIDNELKGETPLAYGLHPNAEIEFRTKRSFELFEVLEQISPRDTSDGDDEMMQSPQHVAENTLNEILERIEVEQDEGYFSIDDVEEMIDTEKGPFQNVFLQECGQMNALVLYMVKSLRELERGFAGELTMSDSMEALQMSLYEDRVPAEWSKLGWPSKRGLASWVANLQDRLQQLTTWTENPTVIPKCTWISGLRNPQSFLTAIMQETAQQNKLELDKLMIVTEVTKLDTVDTKSREGTYINGLFIEGARWDKTAGMIEKSLPKEMSCRMPVIVCKAVPISTALSGIYSCPVYKTQQRGPTYVFDAQLRTKSPAERWVLASVALIMDIPE